MNYIQMLNFFNVNNSTLYNAILRKDFYMIRIENY